MVLRKEAKSGRFLRKVQELKFVKGSGRVHEVKVVVKRRKRNA